MVKLTGLKKIKTAVFISGAGSNLKNLIKFSKIKNSPISINLIFSNQEISIKDDIIATCGSGVSACVISLALFCMGKVDVPIYDGSWTEWATSEQKIAKSI